MDLFTILLFGVVLFSLAWMLRVEAASLIILACCYVCYACILVIPKDQLVSLDKWLSGRKNDVPN